MRRRRKTRAETSAARAALTARAAAGKLVFPMAVREIRAALDLTQAEFGQIFGLSRKQVIDLEHGRANATLETLRKICRPFRFSIGFVVAPTIGDASPGTPNHDLDEPVQSC